MFISCLSHSYAVEDQSLNARLVVKSLEYVCKLFPTLTGFMEIYFEKRNKIYLFLYMLFISLYINTSVFYILFFYIFTHIMERK